MICGRKSWREYLFVDAWHWQSAHASDFWLRDHEVLDLWQAAHALEDVARKDKAFLRDLQRDLLPHFYTIHPSPGSYHEALEDEKRLEALSELLGSTSSGHGTPPKSARLYVCRPKPVAHVPRPLPNPWRAANESIAAAKQTPRGYVIVETVTPSGAPVPQVQLEILLADADLLTRCTDSQGQLRLEPVPQGTCHILVPELDGAMWKPTDGGAKEFTGRTGRPRWHVVKQGECLSKLADHYGLSHWQELWSHPDNQALRKRRKSPHVLWPGDQVAVPGVKVYELVRPTDTTHRIEVLQHEATVQVRLRVRDRRQKGLAGLAYSLAFMHRGSEVRRPGAAPTGDDGLIEERVPVGTEAIVITFSRPKLSFRFLVSELDPVLDEGSEEPIASGVQARLRSLGYACEVAGSWNANTRQALALFQREQLGREQPDGRADAETCRKLEELYGV